MSGPTSEEEEFEFRLRAEREAEAEDARPKTLRERWKSVGPDPEARRQLAREIGVAFGRKQYGDTAAAPGNMAFAKTGYDMLAFNAGRRAIRNAARRTFKGMTKEEASIVADEADRIQFQEEPVTTILGGTTGLIGNMGSLGSGIGGLVRAPGLVGQAAKTATMGKSVAGNVGRAAAGGAAGAQATAAVGDERAATPVEIALSAGLGAGLSGIGSTIARALSRRADPAREGMRIVADELGDEGLRRVEDFRAATGRDIPVAAGAMSPGSATRLVPVMAPAAEAVDRIARADEATGTALRENMLGMARNIFPDAADANKIAIEAERNASEFMQRELSPGMRQGDVPAELPPGTHLQLLSMLRDLQERGIDLPLDNMQARDLMRNGMSLAQFDQVRRNLNRAVDPDLNRELSDQVRNVLNEAAAVIDQTAAPGYYDSVIGDFARLMRQSEGAEAGAKIMSRQTPESFRTAVEGANPAYAGDRIAGAVRGAGEAITSSIGQSDEGARNIARSLASGFPAQKLAELTPEGQRLIEASRQWDAVSSAVDTLRSGRTPNRNDIVDNTMIGIAQSMYFLARRFADLVKAAQVPNSVKSEVADILTNPGRVQDAIEALRKGGVPEDEIVFIVRNTLPVEAGGAVGRAAYDESYQTLGEEEQRDQLITNMASFVSRALYDMRGRQGPNTAAEWDAIEDRMEELLAQGLTPEQAIETGIAEFTGRR